MAERIEGLRADFRDFVVKVEAYKASVEEIANRAVAEDDAQEDVSIAAFRDEILAAGQNLFPAEEEEPPVEPEEPPLFEEEEEPVEE